MKKGQLFILIVLCLIVGSAGWLVKKKNSQSWTKQENELGQLLYSDFPINEVTKLLITTKEKKVELVKESDTWIVKTAGSYYADFSKIADFLKKIAELKIIQKIDVGKDDFGRLELNGPDQESGTGMIVEFFNNNSSINKLLIGKKHMRKARETMSQFGGGGEWPDGRYVFQPKSNIVALVSETFSTISDDSNLWLDKTFIKIDKIKKATVKKGDNVVWTVFRDNEKDSLNLDGPIGEDEKIATSKLNAIDSSFRYANFNKVADPETSGEKHGFSEGRVFTAETFDGFIYTIAIGKKAEDGDYPIKIALDYKEPEFQTTAEEDTEGDETKKEDIEKEKAKKEEEEFKAKVKENKEKFEKELARFPNWVYMVSSNTVENLLLDRTELFEEKKDSKAEVDTTTTDVEAEPSEEKNNGVMAIDNNMVDLSNQKETPGPDKPTENESQTPKEINGETVDNEDIQETNLTSPEGSSDTKSDDSQKDGGGGAPN